jgi:5,10-methylenetetrahydrofolate reductase
LYGILAYLRKSNPLFFKNNSARIPIPPSVIKSLNLSKEGPVAERKIIIIPGINIEPL